MSDQREYVDEFMSECNQCDRIQALLLDGCVDAEVDDKI